MSHVKLCDQLLVFKSSNGKTSSHIDAFKYNQRLEIQFPSIIHSIAETFLKINNIFAK